MTTGNSRGRNAFIAILVLAGAANLFLASRFLTYERETARLREGMTKAQRERTDAVLAAEQHRIRVELELIRRQARSDRELHLAVNIDSGRMVLERDGVVLREMHVRVGPERFPGAFGDSAIQVNVLGQRTVERRLSSSDVFEVPPEAFADRGLPVPEDRNVRGALGEVALILNEGTVVYAVPDEGPLADTSYVLPGSVRVSAPDLEGTRRRVSGPACRSTSTGNEDANEASPRKRVRRPARRSRSSSAPPG